MEENTSKTSKIKSFFKRNAYYITLGGIVAVLALVIGLSAISTTVKTEVQEELPVNSTAIEFVSPLESALIAKGYSATELQYNAALNEWSIHKALDFSATSGENVRACYAGVVENISSNILDGTVITINHGNNLKTVYKSLADDVSVSVGDNVATGMVIAKAGYSSGETQESSQVHFEVWKDDKLVDPAGYLNLSGK